MESLIHISPYNYELKKKKKTKNIPTLTYGDLSDINC